MRLYATVSGLTTSLGVLQTLARSRRTKCNSASGKSAGNCTSRIAVRMYSTQHTFGTMKRKGTSLRDWADRRVASVHMEHQPTLALRDRIVSKAQASSPILHYSREGHPIVAAHLDCVGNLMGPRRRPPAGGLLRLCPLQSTAAGSVASSLSTASTEADLERLKVGSTMRWL